MKKLLFLLCAAALICSCTDNKAQQTAEGFLTSYLNMDYEGIAEYCDSNVAEALSVATQDWEALDSALLARMKEASSSTRFEITSVDRETEKGKAYIKYMLYPMGSEQGRQMSLILTKDGGKWLVSGLRAD